MAKKSAKKRHYKITLHKKDGSKFGKKSVDVKPFGSLKEAEKWVDKQGKMENIQIKFVGWK